MNVEVMIDLETTGLKPGCRILSLGAATFDGFEQRTFYEKLAYSDKYWSDQGTLDWWDKQPAAIRLEAFSGTLLPRTVLLQFSDWLASLGCKQDIRPWGNAASFDLKILEAAYKIENLPLPWSYYNEMCYRTLKNLYPGTPFIKPDGAHNALVDAIAQADHADRILNTFSISSLGA